MELFYLQEVSATEFWIFQLIVLALLIFAWRKPALRFACWWVLTASLPIDFIPRRGAGSLYLPLFGFAFLVALLVQWLADHMPSLRWPSVELGSRYAGCLIFALAIYGLAQHNMQLYRGRPSGYIRDHVFTHTILDKLQRFPYRPQPNQRVLYLTNPFKDWDLVFISDLVWNVPGVDVQLTDKLPNANPDQFDAILDYQDGEFKLIAQHPRK
jgi:hypothetical protein